MLVGVARKFDSVSPEIGEATSARSHPLFYNNIMKSEH